MLQIYLFQVLFRYNLSALILNSEILDHAKDDQLFHPFKTQFTPSCELCKELCHLFIVYTLFRNYSHTDRKMIITGKNNNKRKPIRSKKK